MLSVSILLLMMATQSGQATPIAHASTAKALNDFGSCFTHIQDRASRAWAFMPTHSGGIFTNAGAAGAATIYWLQVNTSQHGNQVRLFTAPGSGAPAILTEAIDQCR